MSGTPGTVIAWVSVRHYRIIGLRKSYLSLCISVYDKNGAGGGFLRYGFGISFGSTVFGYDNLGRAELKLLCLAGAPFPLLGKKEEQLKVSLDSYHSLRKQKIVKKSGTFNR